MPKDSVTPELRALLGRRLLIVEGGSGGTSVQRGAPKRGGCFTQPATPAGHTPLRGSSPASRQALDNFTGHSFSATPSDLRRATKGWNVPRAGGRDLEASVIAVKTQRLLRKAEALRAKLQETDGDAFYAEERLVEHLLADGLVRSHQMAFSTPELPRGDVSLETSLAVNAADGLEALSSPQLAPAQPSSPVAVMPGAPAAALECCGGGEELARLREEVLLLREQKAGLEGELRELKLSQSEAAASIAWSKELRTEVAALADANKRQAEELKCSREVANEVGHLRRDLAELVDTNSRQSEELKRLTQELAAERARGVEATAASTSEGRLRAAMTNRATTTSELSEAVGGVESLVEEARRELAARRLREKRAALEKLHAAMDREEEDALESAIAHSREVEVDEDDVRQGQAKLESLRLMSPEQRKAKLAQQTEMRWKKEAFVLVKKDDSASLESLIAGMGTERWKDWRDYAGRSLWRCAQELRSCRVQKYLAPLLGFEEGVRRREREDLVSHHASEPSMPALVLRSATEAVNPLRAAAIRQAGSGLDEATPANARMPASPQPTTPGRECRRSVASTMSMMSPRVQRIAPRRYSRGAGDPRPDGQSDACTPAKGSVEGSDSYAEFRARALRAVVQDDVVKLVDVIANVDLDIWSQWRNKAGKDLLTLSQERGSSGAYSVLARELGLLKEQSREPFEEREAVWVYQVGEVQPRRATVLEDTSEDAEEILVEFWDGDEVSTQVQRCLVRKMWG